METGHYLDDIFDADTDLYESEDGYDYEDLGEIFEETEEKITIALPSSAKQAVEQMVVKEKVDTQGNVKAYYDDDTDWGLGDDTDTTLPNVPTDGQGLTYEEQMDDIASRVFGTILSGKPDWKKKLDLFKGSMPEELFKEENYLIAKLLNRSIRNKILSPDKIRITLLGQINAFKNYDNHNINLSAYPEINGNREQGLIKATVDKYTKYINSTDNIDLLDMEGELDAYKTLYKQVKTLDILQKAIEIQTTGMGTGVKRLIGPDDAALYAKKEMAKLAGLMESQEGKGFTNMKDLALKVTEKEATEVSTLVCDWGPIPTLNKHTGGIRQGNFYQIMAAAKNGKSKFCMSRVHDALLEGKNVSFWAVEGSSEMALAQLRSCHCNYFHNKNKSAAARISGMPDQGQILDQRMSDEVKELEAQSFNDLITNPNYGSLDFIDRPFNLETFIDEIDTSVTANNSVFLVIDYLQLITSIYNRKAGHEVISDAYKKLLDYCKKKNIAVLTPVQFKQDAITELTKGAKDGVIDLRNMAGGSYEAIKTVDFTLVMFASTQELMNGVGRLLSMPNRFSAAIPDINITMMLDVNVFAEIVD